MAVSAARGQEPKLEGMWFPDPGSTRGWPSSDEAGLTPAGHERISGWDSTQDPVQLCIVSLGRIMSAPFPLEILQNDDRATILYEYDHQIRRIYMDGRGHPDDLYPTLMGHSIGHWEDGALVVETVALEPSYFRPEGGLPYSEAALFTERYQLVEPQRLSLELTVTDPSYYDDSWSVSWTFSAAREILEYRCIPRDHLAPPTG